MPDLVEAQRKIRCGFNEIVAGFTPLKFRGEELYIKHFGARDQIEVDVVYSTALDDLLARGVPNSEQRAQQLEADGLWGKEDDRKLADIISEVDGLRKAQALLFLKSQIDAHQKIIDEREAEHLKLIIKKNTLFGKTAELIANTSVSDFCIISSLFRDPECKKSYFHKDRFRDIDDELIEDLTNHYNAAVMKFDELSLKRIALSPLFQNYYYLAKSVYEFFGSAITNLTFYQIQLVTFGDHYKHILYGSENPPPAEVRDDPEKLDGWVSGAGRAQKVLKESLGRTNDGEGTTFTSLIGAEQSDLKYLGVQSGDSVMSLRDKVKEKGGHLSMKDLMALQGIK